MCLWSHRYTCMLGRSCCLGTLRLFQQLAYKVQHLLTLIATTRVLCYRHMYDINTFKCRSHIYPLSKPGHHNACKCKRSADQNLDIFSMKSPLQSMIPCNLLFINDVIKMVDKISQNLTAFRMLTQDRESSNSQAIATVLLSSTSAHRQMLLSDQIFTIRTVKRLSLHACTSCYVWMVMAIYPSYAAMPYDPIYPLPFWAWFNIKMLSYRYRKSHCGDKTILRPSCLDNGISYTGETKPLYCIGALVLIPQYWMTLDSIPWLYIFLLVPSFLRLSTITGNGR